METSHIASQTKNKGVNFPHRFLHKPNHRQKSNAKEENEYPNQSEECIPSTLVL